MAVMIFGANFTNVNEFNLCLSQTTMPSIFLCMQPYFSPTSMPFAVRGIASQWLKVNTYQRDHLSIFWLNRPSDGIKICETYSRSLLLKD